MVKRKIAKAWWRDGSRLDGKGDALKVARALEAIRETDGWIPPDSVIEAAKNKSSPLHGLFTWDVHKAARERWDEQARRLVREIEFVYVDAPDDKQRYYSVEFIVQDSEQPSRAYVSSSSIRNSESLADFALREVLSSLIAWLNRYSGIAKLAKARVEVDRARKAIELFIKPTASAARAPPRKR